MARGGQVTGIMQPSDNSLANPCTDMRLRLVCMFQSLVLRLRELATTAISSQEAGFTQPRDHPLAHFCIMHSGKMVIVPKSRELATLSQQ